MCKNENLPNLKCVILLSFGFFILMFSFGSGSTIASKALKENGYENLGFYSLAVLYLFLALSCLTASSIVYRLGPKVSLMCSALVYTIWIFSLGLTTKSNIYLQPWIVKVIVYSASALCGIGAATLWVAQGKYLSDCAKIYPERKGLYNSIFWSINMTSSIASSLIDAYLLGNFT
jgi:MFS family permease